jgi:hypothetical protein
VVHLRVHGQNGKQRANLRELPAFSSGFIIPVSIVAAIICLPRTTTVMKSGTKLSNEYYGFALPNIQRQLAKAGIRVAGTLNAIFK